MTTQRQPQDSASQRLRGRAARIRTIGAKLTPAEEQQILVAAEAQRKSISECAPDLLLRGAAATNLSDMEMNIFTELVGVQMLLMDTLEPLLRGDKLAEEQIKALFQQVQTTKAARAQEILVKHSQKQEE